MSTAALVQCLAMVLLIAISGPRVFESTLPRDYRIAHGVIAAVAIAVVIWRVRQLRRGSRRTGSEPRS